MAVPRMAQRQPQVPLPGQGRNVAMEALQSGADRQVQRDATTAKVQIEAMRTTMEAAKLKAAAAQDLSRGIADTAQAFATKSENEAQRQFLSKEATKAQDATASREKAADVAQLARDKAKSDATVVRDEKIQGYGRENEKLRLKEAALERKRGVLAERANTLQIVLESGKGVPADKEEAKAFIKDLEERIFEVNEERLKIGAGQSRIALQKSINLTATVAMSTRQTAKNKMLKSQQRQRAESALELTQKTRDQMLTIQAPLFARQEAFNIIAAGVEHIPVNKMATQVLNLFAEVDNSNPRAQGRGLIRALAQSEGKPSGWLNQIAGKLGPAGMASADALALAVQEFSDEGKKIDDPDTAKYFRAVTARVTFLSGSLLQTPSINGLQIAKAMASYGEYFDEFLQKEGHPPTDQERDNFLRGLDVSYFSGNLNIAEMVADPEWMIQANKEADRRIAAEALQQPPQAPTPAAPSPKALTGSRISEAEKAMNKQGFYGL